MDKETLSNYGWIVICVLVLAVMIALAGPFGNFIADAIKSTTAGFFSVNQNAMESAGITIDSQEFPSEPDPALNPNDGSIPQEGDIFRYGDYEYCYGLSWCESGTWSSMCSAAICGCYEVTDGWGVRCINNVAVPGPILETINSKPVTSLSGTFSGCTALTIAPKIPSTVTNMLATFRDCTSMKTAPMVPNGVTDMGLTFSGCTSLTDLSNLTIPNSVTNMNSTFERCASLIDAHGIAIPSGVYLYGTFNECTLLNKAPVIPSDVTCMVQTFRYCTSLTGIITLNATPNEYIECFYEVDMSKITLAGSCNSTTKQAMANTGKNGSQVTIID